ncbi:MAG: hypothetical protein KatS3mg087_0033 [Patescibacteria group bacterium]|nr:MAG: hypothetical protein KatS3mg087_0033 [Patescibacteria group bacterium]
MKKKYFDIVKLAEEINKLPGPNISSSFNSSTVPGFEPGGLTRDIVTAPPPSLVTTTSPQESQTIPSVQPTQAVEKSPVQEAQNLQNEPQLPEKPISDEIQEQFSAEVEQPKQPTKNYLFKYVDEEADPDFELTGEYGDLYNRLISSEPHWNKFINNVQRVSDVQDLFNKIADPNVSTEERNAAYNRLAATDPYLFRAVNWAARVKQDPNYALKDPESSRVHMHSLFEFGALRYASQGGALTKQLQELQKRMQSVSDPNQKAEIAEQIRAIQQRIARRYASVYAKAMGDQNLTPEDLDLVYSNFASESGLGSLRAPKEVKQTLADWFSDPNVKPLYKAGLLLGIPTAVLGVANLLMGNTSPAMILLSLLGGLGIFMGGRNYLSKSTRVEPGEPLIAARAYSPYAPPTA